MIKGWTSFTNYRHEFPKFRKEADVLLTVLQECVNLPPGFNKESFFKST